MVANVHGELVFVEGVLAQGAEGDGSKSPPETLARLHARQLKLAANRDALYATIRQFDPSLEPEQIGVLEGWRLRFGRKGLGMESLMRRYLALDKCLA
jgi:hypothetical protein